jgi:malate synthase
MPTESRNPQSPSIRFTAPVSAAFSQILTPPAIDFLALLHRRFNPARKKLLDRRRQIQAQLDSVRLPQFLPETAAIRAADWKIAPIPPDLMDRRVEITGPVDRKMVINALNSGARVYMADFEDSHSPTWDATIEGQINLRDAINRTIEYLNPQGKKYSLNPTIAILMVRPRGWHLDEKHLQIDGEPVSASLFDFGLFFFHNARKLHAERKGPYFYLPKLENHQEAQLWNDVFVAAQKELNLPLGSIKATVLIETILAAFEMDEILHVLRDHIVGLNCGRWDYIFSFIKKFRNRPDFVLPDRAAVTMTTLFLRSYSKLLIKTCHRRGAFAMGGMAAQIPSKSDPAVNAVAMEKVAADKTREVGDGHDGTWVAHPGLVDLATKIFDKEMPEKNQLARTLDDVRITPEDLLAIPPGTITEAGLRTNVNVAVRYLESWLQGNGCVPIFNLMEDAATAEISRAQVWQWIRHRRALDTGATVTPDLVRRVLSEELASIRQSIGPAAFDSGRFSTAAELFQRLACADQFEEFLTIPAYEHLP